MSKPVQLEALYYNIDPAKKHLPRKPTDDEIRVHIAENNQNCKLNKIVVNKANEGNMRTLRRFAFTAFKRQTRSCRGCNFGIYSPPGQGKTFIVKKFAETLDIPFVFVQSPILESTHMLFEQISGIFSKTMTPLVALQNDNCDYIIPPCIVFFDEAHELKSSLMKGALLNAMEPNDGIMIIKQPGTKGETLRVDCKNICWIAATTERGDLFDAFESRLTTAIEWTSSEGEELYQIIKAGLDQKYSTRELPFSPPIEVCKLIAKYQKVPRLAIHGFGAKVVQHKDFSPSCTWEECCEIVASDMGLNEYGLTKKQTDILHSLGQRPIAESRLAEIAKCRIAQVKKYELPALMQYNNGGPFVVSVSGRGMCITRNGLLMLEKMGMDHKGDKITAEYFESKR